MFLQGDSFNFIDRRLVVDAPTVERASDAYYKEADGVLTEVGPNEIRYRYDADGNFAGFLLEPIPKQSRIKFSEDFSSAAFWQKTNITIGADGTGPDGIADSATRLTATGTATLEYSERTVGNTTFTQAVGAPAAMAHIEILPEVEDVLPVVHSIGTQVSATTGALNNVAWPAHDTDDIGYLIIEFSGTPINTVSGWGVVVPQTTSGGTDTSSLIVYGLRATSAAMSGAYIDGINTNHKTARIVVVRGAKTAGALSGVVSTSVSATTTATKTIDGFSASVNHALVLAVATYGNDAATNAMTNWANASLDDFTVHSSGEGTTSGDGGGFAVASAEFLAPGFLTGLTESKFTSDIFVRQVSGSDPVKLYNYRDTDTTEFDLSTGTVISGDGTIEQYANGFWRITATKDTGFIPSEYGFGLEFTGEILVFGANLISGLETYQYLFNDEPMTGDVILVNSGANLVYSNVPEPSDADDGPNGSAVIWSAGTFNTGDRAIENHVLYQVTASPTTTAQPSVGAIADPPSWVAVGPSDRWKMFDTSTGSDVATVSDGMVEFVIQSDLILTDFSVHGVDAEKAIITVYEDGVAIYTKEIELITDYGIDDFYDWALKERVYIRQFYESGIPWTNGSLLSVRFVNDSGGTVTVGKFVPGVTVNVGILLDDVEIEARDFSRATRNQFGIASIVQGREIDIKRFTIVVDPDRVAYLIEKLKAIGVAATGWGVPGYDGAIVFGFRTRRDFRYSLIDSRAEITIEEV